MAHATVYQAASLPTVQLMVRRLLTHADGRVILDPAEQRERAMFMVCKVPHIWNLLVSIQSTLSTVLLLLLAVSSIAF